MDPLTHTLAGAALGETGLGRLSRYAGAALVIGANLPDVDALSYLAGPDAGFGFRRGLTHGVLALALWPIVLVWLFWTFDRLASRRGVPGDPPLRMGRLLLACSVGVNSHPILDWLNTYGVRLLSPFDERWFYGDALFIVDPWMWLTLGATVMLARRGRWPAAWVWAALGLAASALVLGSRSVPDAAKVVWIAAIGVLVVARVVRRPRPRPHVIARCGVALAALQVALWLGLALAGRSWVRGELGRLGLAPVEQLMVGPTPADPSRWDVVARIDGAYRRGTLRWSNGPHLQLADRGTPIDSDSVVVQVARESPCIAGTLRWMRFPFAEVEPLADDGHAVYFLDARYARERSRGFGTCEVELDRDLVPRDCR